MRFVTKHTYILDMNMYLRMFSPFFGQEIFANIHVIVHTTAHALQKPNLQGFIHIHKCRYVCVSLLSDTHSRVQWQGFRPNQRFMSDMYMNEHV